MAGSSTTSSSLSEVNQGTAKVEDPKPCQYDFATLYEEWLLQQKNDNTNDDDNHNCQTAMGSSNNNNNNNNARYMRALAARAGRMGTIQCAIRNKPPEETTAFLQALLERLELMDDDKDETYKLPLPDYVKPSPQTIQRRHANNVDVNVDAFFEEYPECIRPDWNTKNDSDDDDDGDDDESWDGEEPDEVDQARPRKKTILSENTMRENVPPNQPPREESTAVTATATALCQNPYKSQSNNKPPSSRSNGHDQPQKHVQNFEYNTQKSINTMTENNSTRAVSSNPSNTQCWEDHRQAQNPFQTAREYYASATSDQLPQQQQHPNNNYPNGSYTHNAYQQASFYQEEASSSPVQQPGPVIRDSLKRKFQPPKRGASNNTREKRSTTNNGNNSSGLRANSKTNKKSSRSTVDDSSGDDDEDLPEELKRYGKDLVDKIRNEIMDSGEKITFDDIAGLEDAKTTIQEIVCWPMKRPDLFTGLRRTPNGLLLFGPPGTGKTLIGKAIAHESGATFFSISSSSLTSKWTGEGEKLVRTLFGVAGYHEPAVVFIDEIDSLLTQRKSDDNEASRRIKTEFLVQLDGTGTSGQGRVLVIGATNRPQELDEAARRRFVKRLYIPLPNENDRACLLKVLLENNRNTLTLHDVEKLAADTKGFSGADLKSLSSDAAMGPIRQLGKKALKIPVEDLPPITFKHFRQSLRGMHPSVSPEDVVQYEVFDKTYGSKRALPEEGDNEEDDNDQDSS